MSEFLRQALQDEFPLIWFPIGHMIIIHVRILRQALQDELPPVWFAIAHMIYMSEFYGRPSRMFLPIWFPIAHRIYMSEFYGRPSQDELPTETVVESVLAEQTLPAEHTHTHTHIASVSGQSLFRSSDFKTSAEVSAGHTGTKPQNGCQLRQHGEWIWHYPSHRNEQP